MSRLEEIKEHYQLWRFNEKNRALPSSTGIDYEDLIYLVNRVEELEEEKHQDPRQGMLEDLHMENERYKQALEYAQSELEYAHVTGNMELRGELIKNSLKAIDEALEGKQ